MTRPRNLGDSSQAIDRQRRVRSFLGTQVCLAAGSIGKAIFHESVLRVLRRESGENATC